MSCFCCLCEWEIILKIFCSFFFLYFELHQLAIIHFMTWMCVPRLAGSPNLAGKQENHLESLLEKGGLYWVLGKLLLAAGWIVYHTLVPLFLDVSWASVLTEGEWQYFMAEKERQKTHLDLKETVHWGSVLCFTTDFSMESFSHSGGLGLAVTFVAISPHCLYLLLRDLIWNQTSSISMTTGQQHNK